MNIVMYLNVGDVSSSTATAACDSVKQHLNEHFPGADVIVFPIRGSQHTRIEFVTLPILYRIKRVFLKYLSRK